MSLPSSIRPMSRLGRDLYDPEEARFQLGPEMVHIILQRATSLGRGTYRCAKCAVRWSEFVIRLSVIYPRLQAGLRGVRVGEAKNPGPSRLPLAERPPIDLCAGPILTAQVSKRRVKLAFGGVAWGILQVFPSEDIDRILADYAQAAYEAGLSLHDVSETVNAV
eukprot:3162932-Amphidinium_carterae.1